MERVPSGLEVWGPNVEMFVDGDVADFFASDHARAVTGQHLMVNSGEMMR